LNLTKVINRKIKTTIRNVIHAINALEYNLKINLK
jgi:hypothetical protein